MRRSRRAKGEELRAKRANPRHLRKSRSTWLLVVIAALVLAYGVGRVFLNVPKGGADGALGATRPTTADVVIFDGSRGCVISLPEAASEAEQRAAKLVQSTLATASGKRLEDFPIQMHERGSLASGQAGRDKPVLRPGSILYIEGSNHRKTGEPRLEEKVAWRVTDGRVEITSYPADAIEAAAAWFLRETLGARWFMPGELGEHVPARKELRLAVGERSYAPSYISRNMSLGGSSSAEQAWWRANRLRGWFKHTHAMNPLFTPEDLRRNPGFVAEVNGRPSLPAGPNESNWQPNIAAEGAAEHAAAVLAKRREFSSPIGMNDSIRYDQSARTQERLGPPRWFRHRPDYSKLVFGFVNDVAKRVPGRYLGAYAYDWTEDTPGFPIERNVVPYLTADRSEWFDPAFADADKALIRRWVASGAEVVGLYDYYYGAPFLVPRPTLYAVAQSIPFAHTAGVRAFYAEVYPNWGLDGPKAWLAAELLWDAKARPEDLLETYYRDFWREAAGPMREYFALCDRQWLNQPKPSYWIKYFKDEHQHLLFPTEVRQKMSDLLAAAKKAAATELTRRRVGFFTQAFAVTDAFCVWQEAKDRLSRLALLPEPDQVALKDAWRVLNGSEARLKEVHAQVTKEAPLAVKATILGDYERNDPRRRAAWRMRGTEDRGQRTEDGITSGGPASLRAGSGDLKSGPQGRGPSSDSISNFRSQVSGLLPSGKELLKDAVLAQLRIRPPTGSMDLEWVTGGPWRGHGEPYETRRVSVEPRAATRQERRAKSEELSGQAAPSAKIKEQGEALTPMPLPLSGETVLRFAGCKQETFSQLTAAEAGKWYVARVKVRGRVSPGNMTFLILNFQDAKGQTMGQGFVDRLPVGTSGATDNPPSPGFGAASGQRTTDNEVELVVWAQAPAKAKWVGLGVRALNQVGEDYAAFSGFSLQEMAR